MATSAKPFPASFSLRHWLANDCPGPLLVSTLIRALTTLSILALGWLFTTLPSQAATDNVTYPNILWITAEDMSANLGCYGDSYADTPNLDAFARTSVRYTHAFATAPVCSPARSCLITGVYATSLGTQRLRSAFPIPAKIRGFPSYLRDLGYYCSNNVKTDYNTSEEPRLIAESWDANGPTAHWRGRRPNQPFFSVFNLMTTHQSRTCVWSFEEFENQVGSRLTRAQRHNRDTAPIPPFYPDTPVVRRSVARYYDCITAMDLEVGSLLRQLEADQLLDETIVFFYSDHGAGMPRGKRTLYDSGLHVPLLIYAPAKYRHLTDGTPGSTSSRLVSFVDFPPTVLSLAGVPVPAHMQGQAFLGAQQQPPRRYVFGARDRVDEAYDLSRAVRSARYLYIRNYLPNVSLNQPEYFSDMADIRREITRLARDHELNEAQLTYAGPAKPAEELYDTLTDPFQIRNLAGAPHLEETLNQLRNAQQGWSLSTRDLGFLPESETWRRLQEQTPYEMRADEEAYPLGEILSAAETASLSSELSDQNRAMQSADPAARYWAVRGLVQVAAQNPKAKDLLCQTLQDPNPTIQLEAAAAILQPGDCSAALKIVLSALKSDQLALALRAARALEMTGKPAPSTQEQMRTVLAKARQQQTEDPLWLFIRFSLEAALNDRTGI